MNQAMSVATSEGVERTERIEMTEEAEEAEEVEEVEEVERVGGDVPLKDGLHVDADWGTPSYAVRLVHEVAGASFVVIHAALDVDAPVRVDI